MKIKLFIGAVASSVIAASAAGDVAVLFNTPNTVEFAGGQFDQQGEIGTTGEYNVLEGTLTEVSPLFFLTNSSDSGEDGTWANDLTILIATGLTSDDDFLVQIGGYSDLGAANTFSWATGSSGAPGTGVAGAVSIGGIDVTGYNLYLGNGYLFGGEATWQGEIELIGVNYRAGLGDDLEGEIPAPGVLALLGLAGVCNRRRRA